mmetsp:Transcript_38382/g.105719  ORF Transcript_38382/g.105719 Transcript_38382/m.105719 type:complete len:330 (+) Transcript_38382:512-1501(+)
MILEFKSSSPIGGGASIIILRIPTSSSSCFMAPDAFSSLYIRDQSFGCAARISCSNCEATCWSVPWPSSTAPSTAWPTSSTPSAASDSTPSPPGLSAPTAAANCSAMRAKKSCGTRSTNFVAMLANPSSRLSCEFRDVHSSRSCFTKASIFRSFTSSLISCGSRLAGPCAEFGVGAAAFGAFGTGDGTPFGTACIIFGAFAAGGRTASSLSAAGLTPDLATAAFATWAATTSFGGADFGGLGPTSFASTGLCVAAFGFADTWAIFLFVPTGAAAGDAADDAAGVVDPAMAPDCTGVRNGGRVNRGNGGRTADSVCVGRGVVGRTTGACG